MKTELHHSIKTKHQALFSRGKYSSLEEAQTNISEEYENRVAVIWHGLTEIYF